MKPKPKIDGPIGHQDGRRKKASPMKDELLRALTAVQGEFTSSQIADSMDQQYRSMRYLGSINNSVSAKIAELYQAGKLERREGRKGMARLYYYQKIDGVAIEFGPKAAKVAKEAIDPPTDREQAWRDLRESMHIKVDDEPDFTTLR